MIKLDKKAIMPIVVLVAICVIVAAILGAVNMLTAPKISEREEAKANAALLVVLPGAKNFEILDTEGNGYPKEVNKAYKADKGYVFEVSVKGKEAMTVMCGVDNDGKFVALDVVTESETPDYKNKVFPLVTGENGKYKDKTADTLEPEIVSGATLTSNGIYNAVKVSLDAYTVACGGELLPSGPDPELQRPESELLTLMSSLVTDSTGFTKVELEGERENLAAVYKENGGKGYVAYVLVISESYGTVESEALIHIANNGKISAINRLVWKTSDAMYGYVPPSADAVDAFYEALKKQSSATIDSVELVTNATNTSGNVVASFKEALEAVDALIIKDMPTPEAEVLTLADTLVGGGADFVDVTEGDNEYVRRIYKDKNGKGYVAYVVVISSNYGTVETETLVHVGNNGKIKAINRLVWKTSDLIETPYYSFYPPSQDEVDAFYARLNGASSSTIDAVEHITGATTTSGGLKNSLKEALKVVDGLIKKDMPTPEAEVLTLADTLVGGGADFVDVTESGNEYVRRIYKDKNGKGYVAYVVVISANYGTVESEALIHIGNDAKIKAINRLVWKTSDLIETPYYSFYPPSQDEVDAFYARLNGASLSTIDAVEHISGATTTSGGVKNSFKEALTVADGLIKKDMPTTETKVLELAAALVGNNPDFEDVTPDGTEFVRRIYRDKNGEGFVAYVVVISSYYGTTESEALIHIGTNGKILGINKMTWKTSEAGWGYVPPTTEEVDAFYGRLVGQDSATIGKVALVTNATNTSTGVQKSVTEALKTVDGLIPLYKEANTFARVVGIALTVLGVGALAAMVVITKKMRGGKNR